MFERSGTYNSELSDHALIYGIIKEKVKHHRGKVIKFRSAKHLNPENFKEHLSSVPWHVGDIFKSGKWFEHVSKVSMISVDFIQTRILKIGAS